MIVSADAQELEVCFGSRSMLGGPNTDGRVLIVPTHGDWNDFGHHSRIDVVVPAREGRDALTFPSLIGFIDGKSSSDNGSARLREMIRGAGAPIPVGAHYGFFTMLPDMETYRSVVSAHGVQVAAKLLLALRDVVATQEFDSSSSWLSEAVRTEIFLLSFVRSSEAFFAFRNAGSILRGLDREALDAMSTSLRIAFELDDGRSYKLNFNFDHGADLPRRVAVIIGKNGVGKSQVLRRIAKSALAESGELQDGSGGRPMISRVLAFAPTNEAASVFPPHGGKKAKVWYRRHSLNRSAGSRAEGGTSDLIIQVARSPTYIGASSKWDIFLGAISAIRRVGEVCISTHDGEFIPLVGLLRRGEMQKLELFARVDPRRDPVRVVRGKGHALSSGELSFLKFAAQASLSVENGSLLLLDEPETHLHPNFVGSFVSLLNRLLSSSGSAAIVATHSVYFVREVFREQVSVLGVDPSGAVQVQRPTLKTFGADVGAISYFVFGEDEPSDLAQEVETKIIAAGKSWPQIYEEFKDELSLEFLNRLRAKAESSSEAD